MGRHIPPEYLDAAGGGSDQSEGHADGSCFAGTVGAKETKDFAATNFQVEVVHGQSITIMFREIVRAKNYFARRRAGFSDSWRCHKLFSHTSLSHSFHILLIVATPGEDVTRERLPAITGDRYVSSKLGWKSSLLAQSSPARKNGVQGWIRGCIVES